MRQQSRKYGEYPLDTLLGVYWERVFAVGFSTQSLIEAGTPYKSKVGEEIFANAATS
jgi:hypothetical protein